MGQICLQENDLKQAYTYFKIALDMDNMNINLKNNVELLKKYIERN